MTATPARVRIEQDLAFIQVDYPPATDDPARIFRSMARLIDAFHRADRELAHAVSAQIEPVLTLERIEAGSLRAWLRTVIRQVDDDSLKNLDWKPLVGQYLVRGKHRILSWLDGRTSIQSRAEIMALQEELHELASPVTTDRLLAEPIPPARLIESVRCIAEAASDLRETDTVRYVSDQQETTLDPGLQISSEEVEQLLTQGVVSSTSRLPLLVKKPDYLGNSRWEFRLDERTIEAKILDEPWLSRFRAGAIPLRPGDALDSDVRSELYRGFEGNVVGTRYFVELVHGIVHAPPDEQGGFDFE